MRPMSALLVVAFVLPFAIPAPAEACGGAIRLARASIAAPDPRVSSALQALDRDQPKLALRRARRITDVAARRRVEGLAFAALGRHRDAVLALDEAQLKGLHDERLLGTLATELDRTGQATRATETRTALAAERLRRRTPLDMLALGAPMFDGLARDITIGDGTAGLANTGTAEAPAPVVPAPEAAPELPPLPPTLEPEVVVAQPAVPTMLPVVPAPAAPTIPFADPHDAAPTVGEIPVVSPPVVPAPIELAPLPTLPSPLHH